jgi:hypothetical protein
MPQEPTSSRLRSLLQAVGRRAPQRAALPSTRVPALPVGGTKVSRAATLAPIAASRIASSLAHHKRRPTPPPPSDLRRPRPRQPRARRHQPRGSQALRRPPLPLFSLHASLLDPPYCCFPSPSRGPRARRGAMSSARAQGGRPPPLSAPPLFPRGSRLLHPYSSGLPHPRAARSSPVAADSQRSRGVDPHASD